MNDKLNSKPEIIVLLTDFGTKDYFVGAMRGVILSINRDAKIVDITHEIPPQDIRAAGFTLRACYKNFPEKTIFVAVVDPGVGSKRRAILVETDDFYFIAPDNGLLSFIFNEANTFRAFELTNEKFFAANVSRTFHGRDIFAPVAAHLSNGAQPNEFGAEIKNFICAEASAPRKISANEIEFEIVHIDSFGNLVTNLKAEDLPEKFTLEIGGKRIAKRRNYFAEADENELFIIAGSAGFLEIAAFGVSAAKLTGAKSGLKITLTINS
ncbi:MAG: SAM hydrolase/SAM-dependent halogenase family protein [Pyrinomonadaceae bacterium]